MHKYSLEFQGFEEIISNLQKIDGDVKKTTEKALKKTNDIVYQKAKQAIQKHRRTGRTESSLRQSSPVNWGGDIASIDSGFDIENGGLPSIFLMYGTPRQHKDQQLFNAFFSKKTIDEIRDAQASVFFDEIRRLSK